jgi:hypothetical protein
VREGLCKLLEIYRKRSRDCIFASVLNNNQIDRDLYAAKHEVYKDVVVDLEALLEIEDKDE